MASVLKALLDFLHKLYSSGNYIKHFSWRFVLFLAFLGRKLRRLWPGESGTARRKSTPTEPPSPCARASSRTASRDSAGLKENLVACSIFPTSARGPGLQDPGRGRTRQPATTIPLVSLHPPVDHPSRLSRAAHREPGRGRDTSRSMGRRSRSSPTGGLDNRTIPSTSPAVPPSLESVAVDAPPQLIYQELRAREEPSQRLPLASHVVSDPRLPRGKALRLITSEQVPRYTKSITILKALASYQIKPLTTIFP
ncbi:hypothetical protein BJV78DRAFT_239212 [Lactifluus subvellereus]|nr:hypothetical protein BJV78DRAFT_239212 [Lactifluus subvellereus]